MARVSIIQSNNTVVVAAARTSLNAEKIECRCEVSYISKKKKKKKRKKNDRACAFLSPRLLEFEFRLYRPTINFLPSTR